MLTMTKRKRFCYRFLLVSLVTKLNLLFNEKYLSIMFSNWLVHVTIKQLCSKNMHNCSLNVAWVILVHWQKLHWFLQGSAHFANVRVSFRSCQARRRSNATSESASISTHLVFKAFVHIHMTKELPHLWVDILQVVQDELGLGEEGGAGVANTQPESCHPVQ